MGAPPRHAPRAAAPALLAAATLQLAACGPAGAPAPDAAAESRPGGVAVVGPTPGPANGPPWTIPVLVLKYFPVTGDGLIDATVTGDYAAPLDAARRKTDSLTVVVREALEAGSAPHGYRDPAARPSLRYRVVEAIEHLEPLPTFERPGRVPMTDYGAIMERHDIRAWVEERGVREVWIWGYHGGVLDLWESNMAGPWGDISNSDRDTTDLPVTGRTYTVYHYNYQRGAAEAVENHMHQLEHVLNFVDGRDATAPAAWDTLLFWGRFVGSDSSHRVVRPGCGWSHIPPNGERDYDWANPRPVTSDCEDWRPDGTGERRTLTCERWGCDHLSWFIYWTQNMPGRDSGLTHHGRPLTNWWRFIGDFDGAMTEGIGLVEGAG